MEQCILTVGTVTRAVRARKALSAVGIAARLTKSLRDGTGGGCAYGVEISPADMHTAMEVLNRHGIPYEWTRTRQP